MYLLFSFSNGSLINIKCKHVCLALSHTWEGSLCAFLPAKQYKNGHIYSLRGQKYSASGYGNFPWKDLNDLVFHEKVQLGFKEPLNHRNSERKKKNRMWSLAIISSNTFHITMRKNELFLMPLNNCWFIYSHQQWVDIRLFKLAKPFFKADILA